MNQCDTLHMEVKTHGGLNVPTAHGLALVELMGQGLNFPQTHRTGNETAKELLAQCRS